MVLGSPSPAVDEALEFQGVRGRDSGTGRVEWTAGEGRSFSCRDRTTTFAEKSTESICTMFLVATGSFDHVAYIALNSEYPWRTHVSNAESWSYSYGTALLSELPLVKTIQHTFQPSPPTLEKVLCSLKLNELVGVEVTFARLILFLCIWIFRGKQCVRNRLLKCAKYCQHG